MRHNFWETVHEVIEAADIVLLVMDARDIDGTRNLEIEEKTNKKGKALIHVMNKSDLAVGKSIKTDFMHFIPVSCKTYAGIRVLKDRIMIVANRLKLKKPIVGVLGYPNMGKSSLINALSGKGKARTSPNAGFTHGKQHVRSRNFILIDTPGVIPYKQNDDVKDTITGIKTDIKEPDAVVLKIISQYPGIIEKQFNVSIDENKEKTLAEIALKLNCLKKGGEPDTVRASKVILKDLREGRIIF